MKLSHNGFDIEIYTEKGLTGIKKINLKVSDKKGVRKYEFIGREHELIRGEIFFDQYSEEDARKEFNDYLASFKPSLTVYHRSKPDDFIIDELFIKGTYNEKPYLLSFERNTYPFINGPRYGWRQKPTIREVEDNSIIDSGIEMNHIFDHIERIDKAKIKTLYYHVSKFLETPVVSLYDIFSFNAENNKKVGEFSFKRFCPKSLRVDDIFSILGELGYSHSDIEKILKKL